MSETVIITDCGLSAAGVPPRSCASSRRSRTVRSVPWWSRAAMALRQTCCILGGGAFLREGASPCPKMTVVHQLEDRGRALERRLGRKTLEPEILREALDWSR